MKLGIVAFLSLLFACAPPHNASPPIAVGISDYAPHTDNDIEEQALRKHEIEVSEQKAYDDSLAKITDTIRSQALDLEICSSAGTKKECAELLEKYCQVDTLVDTRGGHWKKPFCKH